LNIACRERSGQGSLKIDSSSALTTAACEMNKKYLQPSAYLRKVRFTIAKLLLLLKVPLKVRTHVDDMVITFVTTSYTEHVLRARESFRREEVTMYWLRSIVSPVDVVYDVGANVGPYSLYAGHKFKRANKEHQVAGVYAFEPAFSNFFPLCRNIEANELNDVVVPFPLAFGKERHETEFFLRSTVTGSALHGVSQPSSEGKEFDPKFRQGIGVTSLNEFVENRGVRFPNHIKIDVDGSELDIIHGANRVLADLRLKSIMIEVNADLSKGRIEKLITEHGFEEEMVEEWEGKNTFNKLYLRKENSSNA